MSGKILKQYIEKDDQTIYTDEEENPDYYLKTTEEVLYTRLGLRSFLIERDGHFTPSLILMRDWSDIGKDVYEKHIPLIKGKVCKHYRHMRESGLISDALQTYMFVIGLLMASDVPRAIAVGVAGLVARIGLDVICD